MSYNKRLTALITIDSAIVLLSIYMSHFFLNPYAVAVDTSIIVSSLILLSSHHLFSYKLNFYRRAWRYASLEELAGIILIVSASILLTVVTQLIVFNNIYERALIITWMLHIIFMGGVRFSWRYYTGAKLLKKKTSSGKRTLIIGAGAAGRMIARQLKSSDESELYPVAFIDDDRLLKQLSISGITVEGSMNDLELVIQKNQIEHIIIAIPSLKQKRLNEIITEAKSFCEDVQILPKIEDVVLGKISINLIRDVSIEDLLGREPVQLDVDSISDKIEGRTILVTGAGGSIGSEICRQVSQFNPKEIVLLGHGEFSIYNIEKELIGTYPHISYPTEIVDVQDRERMFEVLTKYKPAIVYHAAAHKHVPLMERNPEAAVKNNIIGTKNSAEAADAAGVETFVMVSTDKAVNPTNVMGATKRLAEMLVQDLDSRSKTKFVAVRFGNVLGSRGSVIPLFKEQIRNGGPVTITHPDMVRYFMTIPEASRLVIQAGSLAWGGEIFVLDMGEPVKIIDLARNLITLSGFTEEEIGITYSGIRPGEKMYEELLGENEVHNKQVFPKIYIGKSADLYIEEIQQLLTDYSNVEKTVLTDTLLNLANNKLLKRKDAIIV
ncbi:polysaccharide biosynthesis protein [Fictibacillus phosphorivorans]|uniref:polysaccharide biosynthesis protein n=1 Tax=Fictibacillus phosphorivorans TaxID=1221500 RepID=UPI003CFAE1E8